MQKPRVLLIDDAKTIREMVSFILKDDYQVLRAENAKEGFNLAMEKPHPDLILLDIIMKDIDGYKAIKHFKATPDLKHIPVIFLTSKSAEEEEAYGLELGAVDYIGKPINSDLLQLRVSTQIRLQRAIKEANTANQAKSEFLSNISHELRTPMHGILSYAKMGISRFDDVSDEKKVKYFTNIKISADRLLLHLNDLLDLAKLESGKMEMNFTKNYLKMIAQDCLLDQQARIDELNLNYELICMPDDIDGAGSFDAKRIGQVITNLLANAIKYSDKDKCIDFTIKKTKLEYPQGDRINALFFSVRDYGVGIPEGEFELIFNKFTQSSDTTVATSKGTGLGLPICKEIIDLHHGKIWAENHTDGGAIFSFIIPIDQVDVETPHRRKVIKLLQ